ncbi:MAG TPA: DMT family transporter [Firmicutes bacterium]|nr:DMT family transporter [Candidatus Fermentithermobacillaceae bacterium]
MSQLFADFLLLLVTIVWGSTFVLVKNTVSSMGPLTFIAVRFFIGGMALLVWYGGSRLFSSSRAVPRMSGVEGDPEETFLSAKRLGRGAFLTGFALFFAYVTQTLGLMTIPAGRAAFITGLSVVIVPLASNFMFRASPDKSAVVGVSLATVGLGFMSLEFPFRVAAGDLLVFLCALGFAAHILLVDSYSKGNDPVLFAAVQLLVVSGGSFATALSLERPLYVPPGAWGTIVFMALLATSFTFLTQSAVQRYTSATHTALIFSAEPVFGAVFAWLLAGEVLSLREIVGAGLILAGMLVSELGPVLSREPDQEARREKGKASGSIG